jgi:hypothetical protein
VVILKALAESQLSIAALDDVLASEAGKQNRDFLRYERFIKTARQDLAAGLEYFDRTAAADRRSVFSHARREAASVEPSQASRQAPRSDRTRSRDSWSGGSRGTVRPPPLGAGLNVVPMTALQTCLPAAEWVRASAPLPAPCGSPGCWAGHARGELPGPA